MDQRQEYLQEQFITSLRQLVEQGTQMIGEPGVVRVMEEMVDEMGGSVAADDTDEVVVERSPHFSTKQGTPVLTLSYASAKALKADMETLTRVRGLMVEPEEIPPLMESMAIDIKVEGNGQSVRMNGRAVHASNDGVAIELFPPEDKQKQQLRGLVDGSGESEDTTVGESQRFESTPDQPREKSPDAVAPVDQLVERPEEVAQRWSLRDADLEAILLEVATIDGYGFLEFKCSDAVRHYVIHYGKLIDVRSDPVADSESLLIDKLKSTGHITSDDVERAEVLASIHGIPRQDALVDMGCITLEELLDAIKGRLVDELHRIWELDADEARLYLLQHRPSLRLRRSSIDLARQVARRVQIRIDRLSAHELEQQMKRFSKMQIACVQTPEIEWARFGFDSERRRFAEVILEKRRTVSETERISNLRGDDTRRMLLVLDELDLLEQSAQKSRRPEHYEIEGLYKRIQKADHFEVLGVHWSAHGLEIKEAYEEMRCALDVPPEVEEDLAQELEELRQATSEAYRVLSDRRRRREYRNQRIDRFAKKSVIEVYEKKIDSLGMRRQGEELVNCLRRILELQPKNREARAKLKALQD